MINTETCTITAYFGGRWPKTCTVTASILRICTAVMLQTRLSTMLPKIYLDVTLKPHPLANYLK